MFFVLIYLLNSPLGGAKKHPEEHFPRPLNGTKKSGEARGRNEHPRGERAEEAGQAIRVRRGDVESHAVGPFEAV